MAHLIWSGYGPRDASVACWEDDADGEGAMVGQEGSSTDTHETVIAKLRPMLADAFGKRMKGSADDYSTYEYLFVEMAAAEWVRDNIANTEVVLDMNGWNVYGRTKSAAYMRALKAACKEARRVAEQGRSDREKERNRRAMLVMILPGLEDPEATPPDPAKHDARRARDLAIQAERPLALRYGIGSSASAQRRHARLRRVYELIWIVSEMRIEEETVPS